jgi:7,8-dihydropterin-6-yl-methyl-4-(beta-D-ribofuranosyl)aminobenzene 5'-phosphate synthase
VGLLAEHGLAILVEAHGKRVLFDAGQTNTALHNARQLGLELTAVDAIVLSHGHYDHTGGLRSVLQEMSRAGRQLPVFAHPQVFAPRYSLREGERARYTGLPFREEELAALGAQFHYSAGPMEIFPGIWTTGEVPRHSFEQVDDALRVQAPEGWRQDEVADDQGLVVRTPRGLVVVLGCAHSGIVNTLDYVRQFTGESRLHAVVGGTHLGLGTKGKLEPSLQALKEMGIERLGVSHCTGPLAAARLAEAFGPAFFFNNVGTVAELG